ncbi:MAG: hypothetical protein ACJ786_21720, partial [Catenulispora sp.]
GVKFQPDTIDGLRRTLAKLRRELVDVKVDRDHFTERATFFQAEYDKAAQVIADYAALLAYVEEDNAEAATDEALDARDAEDGDEDHFTRAQMDGEACTVCGIDFAEDVPTVQSAYDFIEGQLFAHAACVESDGAL